MIHELLKTIANKPRYTIFPGGAEIETYIVRDDVSVTYPKGMTGANSELIESLQGEQPSLNKSVQGAP